MASRMYVSDSSFLFSTRASISIFSDVDHVHSFELSFSMSSIEISLRLDSPTCPSSQNSNAEVCAKRKIAMIVKNIFVMVVESLLLFKYCGVRA